MKYHLVTQGDVNKNTLSEALMLHGRSENIDRLDVAVAYATLSGLKALELAFSKNIEASRWVIGLDDAITQPEALTHLLIKANAEVRVASMTPTKRFHPKLYCAWSSKDKKQCISTIGSGNMTVNGLHHNGEIAVILSAESGAEVKDLRSQWNAMWGLGTPLTAKIISDYKLQYKEARKYRKKLSDSGISPPEPSQHEPLFAKSEFDGTPKSASIAWLEAGSPSAGGRDLEFPKKLMPFFRLKKSPSVKKFELGIGRVFSLTFTERQDNQMWRLLFSRDAINAGIGRDTLRPETGGNRSDLAIIFRKKLGETNFLVDMVPIGGETHLELVKRSKAVDGLFFTTRTVGGRKFGFL